jgi:hypothetical protein
MRKVVLIATLALALPTALASSTIDYASGGVMVGNAAASVGGSISASRTVAVPSTINSVNLDPTDNLLSVGGLFNGGGSTSLVLGSNGDAMVPVPERGTLGLLGTGLLGIAGVVRRKLNMG